MRKFRFTLDSVLTLRQRAEKEMTARYAQALLAQHQVIAQLDLIEKELNASRAEMRHDVTTGAHAAKLSQSLSYLTSLEKRRDHKIADLRNAERQVQSAMQAMLAARQQCEVVQKFFDKQKGRFNYECAREEQKFMDDLASGRGASPLSWARG